jgi:hypothetical protein
MRTPKLTTGDLAPFARACSSRNDAVSLKNDLSLGRLP